MGLFSGISAISSIQKIQKGGTAKLSIAQIASVNVNVSDARKNLSKVEFEKVYGLYNQLLKCKSKIPIDINGYYEISAQIIYLFDQVAPYSKYSGRSPMETSFILSDVYKMCSDGDKDFLNKIILEIK